MSCEKAVLISIRPEWVERILSGAKTVEVRKTVPKIKTPFKCYIYCTRAKRGKSHQWLIDKNVLLDGLREWKNDDPYRKLRWPWERWIRDVGIYVLEIVVKQMKPVDAVEVVRCEDCKFCRTFFPEKQIGKEARQVWYCDLYRCNRKADEYCSDGERPEEA